MAPKPGDIVKAHCSHCKLTADAEVMSAVGDEIVTARCRTCGTSQPYRSPQSEAARPARRVVEVVPRSRGGKRNRSRTRRVVSTTGREIPKIPPPAPKRPEDAPQPRPVRKRDDKLFKRWDEATDQVDARYARPHRAHERYEAGEAVLHKVHGMGIVEEVAENGELKVLFREGYVSLWSRRPRGETAPPPGASVTTS